MFFFLFFFLYSFPDSYQQLFLVSGFACAAVKHVEVELADNQSMFFYILCGLMRNPNLNSHEFFLYMKKYILASNQTVQSLPTAIHYHVGGFLSREFREGLPMELLYADDLVLIAETKELLLEKVRKWKEGMEKKGLRVNAGKTKIMWCRLSMGQAEDCGEYPCGVCRKGVGDNSIFCVECRRWVHKRCSGISGKLKSNVDYYCRRCCLEGENGLFQSVLLKEVVIEPNVKLECVPKFCYLGDTLGAGEGVEEAARARVRCAWAKFKELSPILTARGASYRIKGKIYKACVQSALTYGNMS